MTNSPFDLEALGHDGKSRKNPALPKHCLQPDPFESLRKREGCKRRWIASLVALLICLAIIVVTIGLVEGLLVRYKVKRIKCNVSGAHFSSSTWGSVVRRPHARQPQKGGHRTNRVVYDIFNGLKNSFRHGCTTRECRAVLSSLNEIQ